MAVACDAVPRERVEIPDTGICLNNPPSNPKTSHQVRGGEDRRLEVARDEFCEASCKLVGVQRWEM